MSNEIWKDIPNYEGRYQVSNLGRVRSLSHKVPYRVKGFYRVIKGRVLKQSTTCKGYKKLTLPLKGKPKNELVHRLVLTAFSDIPPQETVNHKDGDPANNKLENLEWMTRGENCRHAVKTGLSPCQGSTHYLAVDKNKINEIRDLLAKNISPYEIAKLVSVSVHLIYRIKNGTHWSCREI